MQKIFTFTLIISLLQLVSTRFAYGQDVLVRPPIITSPSCPADLDGSINFLVVGDTNNYFFDWSGGNAQTGFSQGLYRQRGLSAATYTVLVVRVAPFGDTTISLTLADPNPLLVSAGSDIKSCLGLPVQLNGTASAAATYLWQYTDGTGTLRSLTGNRPIIPGSGAGSLAVNTTTTINMRVTSTLGCVAQDDVAATVNPVPVSSFTFSRTRICAGETVDVTFTGSATSDATYSWLLFGGGGAFLDNGLITSSGIGPKTVRIDVAGTGLPPNRSILLRVTEPTNNGSGSCQANRSNNVIVEGLPVVTLTGAPAKLCVYNAPVLLGLSPAGGTLSGPGIVGSRFSPAVAGVGTHRLVYKYSSATGCTDSAVATVRVYAKPTVTLSGLAASYCQGSFPVLVAKSPVGGVLTGSGIVGGLIFIADSGVLGTNLIQYAFTDTTGCSDTARVAVTVKQTPKLTALPDSIGICSGGLALGQFVASPVSATVDYSAVGTGTTAGYGPGSGNVVAQPLTGEGTVTYSGTAQLAGCTSPAATLTVRVSQTPILVVSDDSVALCAGQSTAISLSASPSGTAVSWQPIAVPAGVSGGRAGSGSLLQDTLYNSRAVPAVIVYRARAVYNGCIGDSSDIKVLVKPVPTIVFTRADTVVCSGDSVRLVMASGVAGTQYAYATNLVSGTVTGFANGAGGRIAQQLLNADTLNGVVRYTIASSANGCAGQIRRVQVLVRATPKLLSPIDTIIVCGGRVANISLVGAPRAGTTFTYAPTVLQGAVTGAVAGSGFTITDVLSGTGIVSYGVTPRASSCAGPVNQVLVKVPARPDVAATPSSAAICSGQAAVIALSTVSGDSVAYVAVANALVGGAVSGSGSVNQVLTLTGTGATVQIYRAFAYAQGCPGDTIAVPVLVQPKPILTLPSGAAPLCSGDTIRIAPTVNQSGATIRYFISAPATVTGLADATGPTLSQVPVITDTVPATVIIKIVATTACSSDTLIVAVIVKPRPTVIATATSPVCSLDTLRAGATISPVAAVTSYTFVAPGITGLTSGSGVAFAGQVRGAGAGQVVFATTLNGCAAADTVPFTVLAQPAAPIIAYTGPGGLCPGATAVLSTQYLSGLSWSLNGMALSSSASVTASAAGRYTVVYQDLNGCGSGTDTLDLLAFPAPAPANVRGDTAFCPGGTARLATDSSMVSVWLASGVAVPASGGQAGITVGLAGNYQVVRTNLLGCSDTSAAFRVTERVPPPVPVILGAQTLCGVDTDYIYTNPGAASYRWTLNGILLLTTTGDSLMVVDTGTYQVRIQDAFGCSSISATYRVGQGAPLFTASAAVQRATCLAGGSIRINLAGDTANLTYNWQQVVPSPGTLVQTNVPVGSYSVRIVDTLQGCTVALAGLDVLPADSVQLLTTLSQPLSCAPTGSISTRVIGGSGRVHYDWSGTGTGIVTGTPAQAALTPGTYQVVITDSLTGCLDSSVGLVINPADTLVAQLVTTSPTSCALADGKAVVRVMGLHQTDFYRFGNATAISSLDSATGLGVGRYVAVVRQGVCVDSLTFVLTAPGALPFIVSTLPTSCGGVPTGRATLVGTVGNLQAVRWFDAAGTVLANDSTTLGRLDVGAYTVRLGAGYCYDTLAFTIGKPDLLTGIPTLTPPDCGAANGAALAQVNATIAPTLSWYLVRLVGDTLVATGNPATGLIAGTYKLVAQAGNCRDSLTFLLRQTFRLSASVTPAPACDTAGGVAVLSSPSAGIAVIWQLAGVSIASGDTLRAQPGTYLAIASAGGCSDSLSVTISRTVVPVLAVILTPTSTCTSADGVAAITYGPTPFTYNLYRMPGRIFQSAAGPVFAGLRFGTYVAVVRSGACTDSSTFVIARPAGCSNPCALQLVVSSNPVTCQGGQDGQALALVTSAGSGQYQYRINGVGTWTSSDSLFLRFANLLAGPFSVQARDLLDSTCVAQGSQIIGTRTVLVVSTQIGVARCGQTLLPARVSVLGGIAPYQISLDSGRTFTGAFANDTVVNLAAGTTVSMAVRDAIPCRSTIIPVVVPALAVPKAMAKAVAVRCAGGASGSIVVDTILGSGTGLRIRLAGRSGQVVAGFPVAFNNLAAGSYTVVVEDTLSGCSSDTTITIAQPAPVGLAGRVAIQPACGLQNGAIMLDTAFGGTGPYRAALFDVVDALVDTIRTGVTRTSWTGLTEGLYTLRVADAAGCADSITLRLTPNRPEVSLAVTPAQVNICTGQRVRFDAQPSIRVDSVRYTWYINGSLVAGADSSTISLSALLPGDTVQVAIASSINCYAGLPAVATALVRQDTSLLRASVAISPAAVTSCPGSQVRFVAQNVNRLANVTYRFYVADTLAQAEADSVLLITPAASVRVYAVLVADSAAAPCLRSVRDTSAVVSITVQANIRAAITMRAGPDTAVCAGSAVILTTTNNLAGSPGLAYNWLRNGTAIAGANGAQYGATELAGRYTYSAITTAPGLGCVLGLPDTTRLQITFRPESHPACQPCRLRLRVDSVLAANCAGQLNGAVYLTAKGGSGRYRFEQIGRPLAGGRSGQFLGMAQGSYRFTVKDSAGIGCADTLAVTVGARFTLAAAIQAVQTTACSRANDGQIRILAVSGGTAPFRYKIRVTDTLVRTSTFVSLAIGRYQVTVQDSLGCLYQTQAQVDSTPAPRVYAHVSRRLACYGDASGQITVDSVVRGTGGYRYSLIGPDTGLRALNVGAPLPQGFAAGNYTVYVRDAGRCITTASVTIRQPDSLMLAVSAVAASGCSQPTGLVRVLVAQGGTGSRYYLLARPSTQTLDTLRSLPTDSLLRNLEGGDYTLTMRDSAGCSKTVGFRVRSNAPMARAITLAGACPGSANGTLTLNGVSGGGSPYTYTLSRADGFSRVQGDTTFTQLPPGIYTILIRDSSLPACSTLYTRELRYADTLRAKLVSTTASTCQDLNGAVVFVVSGGNPGYRFAYDSVPGAFTRFRALSGDTVRISGLTARAAGVVYTMRLQDASRDGACLAAQTWIQTGNTPLSYAYNTADVPCFGDSTGSLRLYNLRGTGPIRVVIRDAATGQTVKVDSVKAAYFVDGEAIITGLRAGQYNVDISLYGACSESRVFPIEITQPTRLAVHYRNTYGSSPDYPEGEIELDSVSGGVAPYQISLNGASFTAYTPAIYLNRLLDGNVALIVVDSNGCRVELDMAVRRDSVLTVPNVFSPNGDGINDVLIIKNLPADARLTIRNRWGRVVVDEKPYNNKWGGGDLPVGTYIYELRSPTSETKKGWIDIVR